MLDKIITQGPVLVIAPHADDESLGCGGTISRLLEMGCEVHWLIVTSMQEPDYSQINIATRAAEISSVSELFGFSSTTIFNYKPTFLNAEMQRDMISDFKQIINKLKPSTLFLPFRDDVHSDHKIVFDAVISASKMFRNSYVKSTLVYETLSETDFNMKPGHIKFSPNMYVDITDHLEKKIEALSCYKSEIGDFPFPRSLRAVRSLADIRGIQAGCNSAEAFVLLKGIF